MNEVHDLAAPYVLDALEPGERETFEVHLSACPSCQAEVAELTQGIEALFDGVAETAPSGLRSRVLEQVSSPVVVPLRPAKAWIATTAVAAVFALVSGIGAIYMRTQMTDIQRVNRVLAASEATEVPLEGITGRVVHSGEVAVLIASDLPSPGTDRTYQAWLIGADGPVSAGLFHPDDDGHSVVLLEGRAIAGLTVGITEEPAGGSTLPTGEVLASAGL